MVCCTSEHEISTWASMVNKQCKHISQCGDQAEAGEGGRRRQNCRFQHQQLPHAVQVHPLCVMRKAYPTYRGSTIRFFVISRKCHGKPRICRKVQLLIPIPSHATSIFSSYPTLAAEPPCFALQSPEIQQPRSYEQEEGTGRPNCG